MVYVFDGKTTDECKRFQVGDEVVTDYNSTLHRDIVTQHTITARREVRWGQTGVQYQVRPALKNNKSDAWFDAAWFKKAQVDDS